MSLARKNLREIFDLRLRLQPCAVRRAVPRLTVAQLALRICRTWPRPCWPPGTRARARISPRSSN